MKVISHRGCLNGPNKDLENHPEKIDKSLSLGFDVEIDLRFKSNEFFLGHDIEQYKISLDWLLDRSEKIWVHCKDDLSFQYLNTIESNLNYFWHENDKFTLTSRGYIWAFPNKKLYKSAINVLPELNFKNTKTVKSAKPLGICTDYPHHYDK